MAAYKTAVREGVSPGTFWRLTPYQSRIAIEGLADGRLIQAWQTAAFTRMKNMPALQKMIGSYGPPENVEDKMKRLLAAHKGKPNERKADG